MKISVEFPSVAYREGPAKVVELARAIDDDRLRRPGDVRPRRDGLRHRDPAGADVPVADADPGGARHARLRRRRHRARDAVDGGARAAAAPGRARRQAGQHARHPVGRPHAPRRRRRLAGGRVHRPRPGLRAPRAPDGRVDPPAAGVLGRRAHRGAGRGVPRRRHRHGAQAAAGRGAADLGRRQRAGRVPPGRRARRRLDGHDRRLRRRRPGDDRHDPAPRRGRRPRSRRPSGCRRCWRRRRTTAAARTSTPTTTASSPGPSRSATSGFGWLAINATAIFQSGARSVDEMVEQLAAIHTRLRAAVG